jgi:hypothetical protein
MMMVRMMCGGLQPRKDCKQCKANDVHSTFSGLMLPVLIYASSQVAPWLGWRNSH